MWRVNIYSYCNGDFSFLDWTIYEYHSPGGFCLGFFFFLYDFIDISDSKLRRLRFRTRRFVYTILISFWQQILIHGSCCRFVGSASRWELLKMQKKRVWEGLKKSSSNFEPVKVKCVRNSNRHIIKSANSEHVT